MRHESDRLTNQTRMLHSVDRAVVYYGVARGGGRRGGRSRGKAVAAISAMIEKLWDSPALKAFKIPKAAQAAVNEVCGL